MAYPTTVNFQPTTPEAGIQPISTSSSTQQHPLGHTVKAKDATYGEAEFVYLKGATSTAAGDVATINTSTGATVRAASSSRGPLGVAMAATDGSSYGWYAVAGAVPVNSAAVASGAILYLTATAGQVDDAVSATNKVDGAVTLGTDSGGFVTAQLARPAANGNG